MAITTEPSTFEFAREWLLSSECFLRDAMGATAPDIDTARDQARDRIHRHEQWQVPDEEEEPLDNPPPVDSRPLAIVIFEEDRRVRAGTGEWAGNGTLLVVIEAIVPDDYRANHADDNAEDVAGKFKSRREWSDRLCRTIRDELLATSGRSDEAGNPYLNAMEVDIYEWPADPEPGESDSFVGFVYEVQWR